MGVRYSKSIKLGNYLKLNFSKSGVSATVGKKGASVNIGGKGTYLNLSPSLLGVSGTGVSYRKKLGRGYKNSNKKATSKKNSKEELIETVSEADEAVVNDYYENLELMTNLHKYSEKVLNKEEYVEKIDALESDSAKQVFEMARQGDEDTIEDLVGNFMENLELAYDVKVNYELEDNVLYVDLDLPEIETLEKEYPAIVKDKLTNKKKTNAQLKEEYAKLVLSLSAFLSASYFNISSYIDEIVISGFTTTRDNNGDLVDQYLYSIKYTRDQFENTDLSKIDDIYKFILGFENRINMSDNYSFKAIKPYEMESVTKKNSYLDDAILGLKELGYKMADINEIMPQLTNMELESSSDYLKQALNLLKDKAK